jgi:hypothetical protein
MRDQNKTDELKLMASAREERKIKIKLYINEKESIETRVKCLKASSNLA